MKFSIASITTLIGALPHLASALSVQEANVTITNSTACAPIHMILGRGSTESYPGALSTLVTLITQDFPSATYENIIYPAVDETSSDSYFVGRKKAALQITAYAEKCPSSNIVILGYSQGALCISDALAGGGGNEYLGNLTTPLMSPTLKNHISAIIFYGDPRHMPNQTYNMGNGTRSVEGKYPRSQKQLAFLNEHYSDLIVDYCNPDDPVCASGDDIMAHMEYVYLWNYNAAAFVKKKVTETLEFGDGLRGI